MKQTFRQRLWKTGKWFIALFFLLFLFRLIYGYVTTDITLGNDYSNNFFSSVDNLRKNYASDNNIKMKADVAQQASIASAQKYEKTATVKSKTAQFEKDVESVQKLTTAFAGVIQYEQNTGNKGNRQMHWLIGINPARFDSF